MARSARIEQAVPEGESEVFGGKKEGRLKSMLRMRCRGAREREEENEILEKRAEVQRP